MGNIYVVMHGRYTGHGRDEALTSQGIEQCERAADLLKRVEQGPWQVLGSNAPRAVQSAAVIGGMLGQHNVVVSSLLADVGEVAEDAAAYEARLATALEEGGVEYDDQLPLAVVGHLPLLVCVLGTPDSQVGYGEVVEYDRDKWLGTAWQESY